MQTLTGEVESVSEKHLAENSDPEMTRRIERVDGILQALLQFCQRNSTRLEEKARQV